MHCIHNIPIEYSTRQSESGNRITQPNRTTESQNRISGGEATSGLPTHVVILPALPPGDTSCGVHPSALPLNVPVIFHTIHFPRMVWYVDHEQIETVRQINGLTGVDQVILVGFSKSAPGALRVALRIPERIAGIVLFDSPLPNLTRELSDQWPNLRELPAIVAVARAMRATLRKKTRIVLVAGTAFAKETSMLSLAMRAENVAHSFLDLSQLAHRWDSGWMEVAVPLCFDTLSK